MTAPTRDPDWEAFYRDYRKPGFITGYEILTKLGGGVFGIVFKARKESIGKDYAVKFLKLDEPGVRTAVEKELEGVHLFAQVDHPNLVTIEDRGEVHGIPYIVMGFAGSETLRTRLEAGRLDRDASLRIFAQVARGVQALHDHSLVHFDLKPANVFLRGEVARLGDYGLSKLVSASHNSLSFGRGTPYYMAPEMLAQRGDARSDIYSLGVILYELLTGQVPFRGDSEWEILRQHEDARPDLPPELSERERRVIERCLQKDPADRYQSATELLAELFAAGTPPAADLLRNRRPATGAPQPPAAVRTDGPAPTAVAGRRCRGRRLRLGALGLLAVIAVPLAATTVFRTSDHFGSRTTWSFQAGSSRSQGRMYSRKPQLPMPPDADQHARKLVADTYRQLRRAALSPDAARERLRQHPWTAIVIGANELLALNYLDRGDTNYCRTLHEVLEPLAQYRFRFHVPRNRGAITNRTALLNRLTSEQFRHDVEQTMADRRRPLRQR